MGSVTRQRLISLAAATLSLILLHSTPAASTPDSRTAYEVLEEHDFPVGLLPLGVTGYELNSTTGEFATYLGETCSFSIQGSYKVQYDSTIRGFISKGKLTGLEGVKVRRFFLWMDLLEVRSKDGDLIFYVKLTSATFPVDYFEDIPQCGCGFDCSTLGGCQVRKLGANPRVSLHKGIEMK